MKVLLVNTLYYPHLVGGAERSTQILAEGLAKAGIEPVVVSTAESEAQDTVDGVRVYYASICNLYWVPRAKSVSILKKPLWHIIDADNPSVSSRIHPIIKAEKPDIIHTNNLTGFSASVWRVARKCGVPTVHTLRDMYLGCLRSTMFRKGRTCPSQCLSCKILSVPKRRLSRRVDAVIGISEYILNWHLEHGYFPEASVTQCIYNPVKTAVSQTNSHEDRPLTFGFAGALAPHKGIELLLEAFTKTSSPDIRLKVFGAPYRKGYDLYLRQKYADKRIAFCGFSDPPGIFSSIDVNVVPSLWAEPFGRVVPEGYSYGVPAVVSNRGGLPEIVDEDKTGSVFNPDSPGDLNKRLESFTRNPEKVLSMYEACLKAAEPFSQNRIVQSHIDLYERLLA